MAPTKQHHRSEVLIEEALFLAAAGESWWQIPERFNTQARSLTRAFARAGLPTPEELATATRAERSEMERRRAAA